jgi:hypothetical protein
MMPSYGIVKGEYLRNAQRGHRTTIKAIRDGDRKQLVELCAQHLDISRTARLLIYRMRFPA